MNFFGRQASNLSFLNSVREISGQKTRRTKSKLPLNAGSWSVFDSLIQNMSNWETQESRFSHDEICSMPFFVQLPFSNFAVWQEPVESIHFVHTCPLFESPKKGEQCIETTYFFFFSVLAYFSGFQSC